MKQELSENHKIFIRGITDGIARQMLMSPKLMSLTMFISEDDFNQSAESLYGSITSLIGNGFIKFVCFSDDDHRGKVISGALFSLIGDHIYVLSIKTDKELEGLGFATKIMREIEQLAGNVSLVCTPDLIAFYEKIGYREVDFISHEFVKDREIIESGMGLYTESMYSNSVMKKGDSKELAFAGILDSDIEISIGGVKIDTKKLYRGDEL